MNKFLESNCNMKKFTFFATAALALVTFTAKAELMDKAFYKMQTFSVIQDANVTAPGTGTNPITVQSTKTNNTPRYLYTTWGEEGWAKAPDPLPETGYSFSCKFTIAADGGVSNCLEFVLMPVDVAVTTNHMKLQPTTEYFFRFHQAVNGTAEGDTIYVNGDVIENANWNFGERNGQEAVLQVGTEYTIRVDVNLAGTEAKSSIIAADGTVVFEGTKDISGLSNSKMGTLWFNTSGACTYKFDDVKLSTLADGPFAAEPSAGSSPVRKRRPKALPFTTPMARWAATSRRIPTSRAVPGSSSASSRVSSSAGPAERRMRARFPTWLRPRLSARPSTCPILRPTFPT